jgi:glucokinase
MAESQENASRLVGVEASTASFIAVCLDPAGRIIDATETPVNKEDEPISRLIQQINELKSSFGTFDRVGIAVPGLIEKGNSRVAYSAHIPEHAGLTWLRRLNEATGVRTTLENDANAAAYGEYKLGAGRGSRDMFYATLRLELAEHLSSTARSGSVSGFAGEFGFVAINSTECGWKMSPRPRAYCSKDPQPFSSGQHLQLDKIEETQIRIRDIVRQLKARMTLRP